MCVLCTRIERWRGLFPFHCVNYVRAVIIIYMTKGVLRNCITFCYQQSNAVIIIMILCGWKMLARWLEKPFFLSSCDWKLNIKSKIWTSLAVILHILKYIIILIVNNCYCFNRRQLLNILCYTYCLLNSFYINLSLGIDFQMYRALPSLNSIFYCWAWWDNFQMIIQYKYHIIVFFFSHFWRLK